MRAFGDNITLWGTPVVLIETGPWPSAEPDPALVRLNFVAILSALDALATGRVENADPKRYEELPVNETKMLYLLVQNATVLNGGGVPPFTADIGVIANRRVQTIDGQRQMQMALSIDDMGDLRTLGALRTIDARGKTVIPVTDDSMAEGQVVDLPEWRTRGRGDDCRRPAGEVRGPAPCRAAGEVSGGDGLQARRALARKRASGGIREATPLGLGMSTRQRVPGERRGAAGPPKRASRGVRGATPLGLGMSTSAASAWGAARAPASEPVGESAGRRPSD